LGTPVIVSDACARREAVTDGENGFWFRSGDAASLAAQLRELSDDGLAGRMRGAAYSRYWAAPLTMDRHLDRLLDVYGRAAAEARPALMSTKPPATLATTPQNNPVRLA